LEVDFSKISHGFRPQFLKTICELLCKFFISDQERGKSPFRNERVVEAQYDDVVIDDVERMAKFTGVPDAGHMFHVSPVLAEKRDELRSRPVCKAEDYALIYLP
jgi:hypothetical protein